jgi:acylphosphatase
VLVRGRVQGVAFRAYTEAEARSLGLAGWVRNLADGRVEVLAEGSRETLERFLEWCREGPRHARVDGVDAEWEEARGGLGEFHITYSS